MSRSLLADMIFALVAVILFSSCGPNIVFIPEPITASSPEIETLLIAEPAPSPSPLHEDPCHDHH